MVRGISKCPSCGEPVTPFAMGCSICGADIAAARQARERRQQVLPSLPSGPAWLARIDWLDLVVAGAVLLMALFSPFIGLILAGAMAWKANDDRDLMRRNLMLGVAAVALALIILIAVSPGSYGRLLFSIYS